MISYSTQWLLQFDKTVEYNELKAETEQNSTESDSTNRRSNARQSTLSQDEKKELRLAVMLMTVVVVFQICNLPPLICNILEVIGVGDIPYLTQTANLLVTVNSSVNIFIYIILGDKFKRVFLQCLSENLSCCYGGDREGSGDRKVCCPFIKCGRKNETAHRNNGAITGTTDFYMTDALITQPPTLTTYVNTSQAHVCNESEDINVASINVPPYPKISISKYLFMFILATFKSSDS